MQRLQLDFQRRPTRTPWPGLLLLVLALLWGKSTLDQYIDQNAEQAALEATLERHQIHRQAPTSTEKPANLPKLRQDIQRANTVAAQLSLPWDALLGAMERAAGADIALLSIQPNVQKATLKLGGEARNMDALLAYIRRLEKQKGLHQAYLQSHQVQINDPDRPVRFALVATWQGER